MFPDLSHSALEKALNVDVDLTNCNLFCKFVPNRMNCLVTNILYLIQTPETDFPSILQSQRSGFRLCLALCYRLISRAIWARANVAVLPIIGEVAEVDEEVNHAEVSVKLASWWLMVVKGE